RPGRLDDVVDMGGLTVRNGRSVVKPGDRSCPANPLIESSAMSRLDDSDIRPGKIRPASDPDLYRPRRGRTIFKLVLLCLLLAGAAGAAGYLWWTQRGELET